MVRVSPVVKDAENNSVASIKPATMSADWVLRRGMLRAAILNATRLRSVEMIRIRAPKPKTARRVHMTCSIGKPKRVSMLLVLSPVKLVALDQAVPHPQDAVATVGDRGVVGDEHEGLLLLLVQLH